MKIEFNDPRVSNKKTFIGCFEIQNNDLRIDFGKPAQEMADAWDKLFREILLNGVKK
jgi:hypothetical protein